MNAATASSRAGFTLARWRIRNMEELGTPSKLVDQQMGHEDSSVQAAYAHVTELMVGRLLESMTGLWEAALGARREMAWGLPVAVLDRLLRQECQE